VHVREYAGPGRAGGVSVEEAEGTAGRVAGDGEGVAAAEGEAVPFFEGVGVGGLRRGGDPEEGEGGGLVGEGEEGEEEGEVGHLGGVVGTKKGVELFS